MPFWLNSAASGMKTSCEPRRSSEARFVEEVVELAKQYFPDVSFRQITFGRILRR